MDVCRLARIEVSSQHRDYPIGRVLSARSAGWRASTAGEQVIRVVFGSPTTIRRLRLRFHEADVDRTQEFTVASSARRGETHRSIVRQQFTFSRFGATTEVEEYRMELHDVNQLELRIIPDISGGDAVASLAELKIG